MNSRNRVFAVLLTIMIAGCASFTPTNPTPVSFREAEPVVATVCSSLPAQEAAQRLSQAWEKCIQRHAQPNASPLYSLLAARLSVESIDDPNLTSIALTASAGQRKFIYILADIAAVSGCSSEVTVRGIPIGWKDMARHTAVWLDDPADKGPSACR